MATIFCYPSYQNKPTFSLAHLLCVNAYAAQRSALLEKEKGSIVLPQSIPQRLKERCTKLQGKKYTKYDIGVRILIYFNYFTLRFLLKYTLVS